MKNQSYTGVLKQCTEDDVFNASDAYKAQEKFCRDNNVPFFTGSRCSGSHVTYNEAHNPYDSISVNYAASNHITSCPRCAKSHCD